MAFQLEQSLESLATSGKNTDAQIYKNLEKEYNSFKETKKITMLGIFTNDH